MKRASPTFGAALLLCVAPAMVTACAHARDEDPARVALEARLAAHDSASRVLDATCRRLSPGQRLRSEPLKAVSPPDVPEVLHWLDIRSTSALKVRHVSLTCGNVRLSEAWNWYVPSRLPASANAVLLKTRRPFGLVVGPQNFYRQRLHSVSNDLPPGVVLQQRAVLRRKTDHQPIAFVIENYTKDAARR